MNILEKFGVKSVEGFDNVIGIDLGHGETSAALMKINGDNSTVKDLVFNNNDKTKIITAIYISNDGKEIKIGDDATDGNKSEGKLYICFKDRPDRLVNKFENDSRSKKELVQLFFTEVVSALKKYNRNDMNGKNIIFVGCPSSEEWLRYDIEYARVLSEKLDNTPVVIMPESRAALIKVFRERCNEFNLGLGTIIFDSGSSTFDCTYIDEYCHIGLEFSEPLGASYIERKMLEKIIDNQPIDDVKDTKNALIDLRRKKEEYYERPNNDNILCRVRMKNNQFIGPVFIDNEFMKNITTKDEVKYSTDQGIIRGSWQSLSQKFFHKAYVRVGKKPLQTILITGGASRMQFLRDLCKLEFKGKNIIMDDEPSYCVSRGLAWAGFTDIKCAKLLELTKADIKSGISDSLTNLVEGVSKALTDMVYYISQSNIKSWANPENNNKTLQSVLDEIKNDFKKFLVTQNAKSLINESINIWLDSVKNIIVDNVNKRFAKEYPGSIKQIKKFSISDSEWNKIKALLIDSDQFIFDTQFISQSFDLDNAGMIFIKIVITILLIPIAIIDGILSLNIADLAFDKLWEVKKNKIYNKKNRDKMYNQITEKKDDITKKISNNLNQSLSQSLIQEKRENIINTVYENIEKHVEEAVDTVSLYFSTQS